MDSSLSLWADMGPIQILGLIGIAGSFTIMVTDCVGFTRPMSVEGQRYDTDSVPHRFGQFHSTTGFGVARGRTFWASIIGGLAMLPCGLGFATLYVALQPAGQFAALMVSILLGGIMVYGVLSHTLFGLFADLNQARQAMPTGTEQRSTIDVLYAQQLDYWVWFTLSVLGVQAVGSMLYSYYVFSGQSVLPTWMGFLNHFLLSQLFMNSHRFVPFSLSRWLGPPHMHLPTTLPLLILATYYTWP